MATEEVKKVEVEPECPVEPSPVAEVEEKAIVPVENPVTEEKPVDDTNSFAIIERSCSCESFNREERRTNQAWEESEKSKAENNSKKASSIGAWENSKKADLEAEQKKIKENLEKKKS
ncbi:hypothetical protein Lser_V15G39051 [Lactuca serriola]